MFNINNKQEGIWFEENPNDNLMEPITFENDIRDCYVPLRYKDYDPHRYLINPYGDIYDKKRDKFLKAGEYDYKRVCINNRREQVHRLVAGTFCPNPNPEEYIYVNHIDADKYNNYFKNLEWCTPKQNSEHAAKIGLYIPFLGETNGNAKLKNEQVEQICSLMEKGLKYADILEQCGLEICDKNLDILTKIRSKHMWKWISDKYNIPEKEHREKMTTYTDEQIHKICQMIQDGYSNLEIRDAIGINRKDKLACKSFENRIGRIRARKNFTHISKDYKW